MKLNMIILLLTTLLVGCGGGPSTFIQKYEPTWVSVEIRDDLSTEQAWKEVVDIVAKQFELEIISKDGLYLRTPWIYTWAKKGKLTENYRVRLIIKFSANGRRIDIRADAEKFDGEKWIVGYDKRLLETVKTDIMGVVGRVTK